MHTLKSLPTRRQTPEKWKGGVGAQEEAQMGDRGSEREAECNLGTRRHWGNGSEVRSRQGKGIAGASDVM